MQFTPYAVHEIIPESEDIRTFKLKSKDGALPDFQPGNFFLLALPDEGGKRVQRSYSIASIKEEGYLQFCVKLKGVFTHMLWKLKQGDVIEVAGPFGLFTLMPNDAERVFIGGGVGVSPLRAMVLQTLKEGKKAYLFESAHTFEGLAYYTYFKKLERENPLLHYFPCITQEAPEDWLGLCQRLTIPVIEQEIEGVEDKSFYFCGSKRMEKSMVDGLLEQGVPKEKIKTESWG